MFTDGTDRLTRAELSMRMWAQANERAGGPLNEAFHAWVDAEYGDRAFMLLARCEGYHALGTSPAMGLFTDWTYELMSNDRERLAELTGFRRTGGTA